MNWEQKLKKLSRIQHVSIESVGDNMVARMKDVYLYKEEWSSEREAAVMEGVDVDDAVSGLWEAVISAYRISMFRGFTNSQECFWDGRKFVPRGTFEFRKMQRAKRKKAKPAKKNRFNMLEM